MSLTDPRIPFPKVQEHLVSRQVLQSKVQEVLESYRNRLFLISPMLFGVPVNVHYNAGTLHSAQMEVSPGAMEELSIENLSAILPKESKNLGNVSLHATLTVQDLRQFSGGLVALELAATLQYMLRNGFEDYAEKAVVTQPHRVYVSGVSTSPLFIWSVLNPTLLTGLANLVSFSRIPETMSYWQACERIYHLPVRGIRIADSAPEDPDHFPETHFIFTDS